MATRRSTDGQSKAWGVIKAHDGIWSRCYQISDNKHACIWKSAAHVDDKKRLFYALCEPILGYAIGAVALTKRREASLHASIRTSKKDRH